MANRRMFSRQLASEDSFLDMSLQAQAFYFHIGLEADDDGFIANPKGLLRLCGADATVLDELVNAGYIIRFESGVVVIRHWKMQNSIAKDRYKKTSAPERDQLSLDKFGIYHIEGSMNTECIQSDNIVEDSSVEDSIGKDSSVQDRRESHSSSAAPTHAYGEMQNINLSDDEYTKLKERYPDKADEYIDKVSMYMSSSGKTYKDHYATVLYWIRQDIGKAESKTSESKHEDIDMEELIKRERQSQM